MKIARMIIVVALVVGMGQVVNGQEKSSEQGQTQAGKSQAGHAQASRDQLRIAVQEICPVSGGRLGSMGPPKKVKVGELTVFLCCKGCLKGKIDPKHWATIHANVAKAQGICPVMKHKLPKNPKWTIVDGQIVYVCCPPCTKKIAADPATYLREVDELYSTSIEAKSASIETKTVRQ